MKTPAARKEPAELREPLGDGAASADSSRLAAHLVESTPVRRAVQIRILGLRNEQRALGEVNLRVGHARRGAEQLERALIFLRRHAVLIAPALSPGNLTVLASFAAEEVAYEKHQVGGALGQAAHEVGEPVAAVGDIDAHTIGIAHQLLLEIGADPIEHLELELVFGNAVLGDKVQRRRDHPRVVGGDAGIDTDREQMLHQPYIVLVYSGFLRKGDLRRLLVGALTQAHAAADTDQLPDVLLAAVEIRLDDDANRRIVCAHALRKLDSALGVRRAFHVDAHKVAVAGRALDNGFHQPLTKLLA